ncbi:hypothetical protein [Sagittula salina]|uniref:Pentapeptide repeat-containing protein n=1 Tax=Sagittula salina TaxID=2820268 RepID=A0A940MGI9_9RHOB|nr:hypothetical protein [Sagittula salina]MBP0481106.1 hypothetical protein [Sagittula salina]
MVFLNLNNSRFDVTTSDNVHIAYCRLAGARVRGLQLDEFSTFYETETAEINFDGGPLSNTAFQDVRLAEEATVNADLSGAFGDATVRLPERMDRPAHWPAHDLGDAFDTEWRKWQADPEGYTPPPPPQHRFEPDPKP